MVYVGFGFPFGNTFDTVRSNFIYYEIIHNIRNFIDIWKLPIFVRLRFPQFLTSFKVQEKKNSEL